MDIPEKANPKPELILAICRDEAALISVLSQKGLNRDDLVIVSDDLRVHVLAKECAGIQVFYFNQMESFFNVAPHVLTVLGSVNGWLRELGDGGDLLEDLLNWVQHVEGGDTTQRIQDAVLEARSCFAVFDQFKPSKLVIGAGSKSYWEDEVLLACATQRNIAVHRLKSYKPFRFAMDIWQRLRPLAKELYRSGMTIDSIIRRKASGYRKSCFGKYVAIQLCSPAAKHLNHVLPLLKAFEREVLTAVAVTFEIGRTAKTLRSQGYKVVELEAWVPPSILFRSWLTAFKGLRRAKTNLSTFLSQREGGEYAPVIRSALLTSVRNFFLEELPRRIRLDAACRSFFIQNPPLAAKLWTGILIEGVLAYRSLARMRQTLTFDIGPWPYQLHQPYFPKSNYCQSDMVFCLSGEQAKKYSDDYKYDSKHLYIIGAPWVHALKTFSTKYTSHQSRASLGISLQAKLVIFCDAQAVMRGYCSAAEQLLLVQKVIEFAEQYEDVCVLIKPHTNHKPGELEDIFRDRGKGRVIWISRKVLPYDGLNAAHVVLTKFSTLVAEAMILGVPSICVLLDRDMRWAIYKDAVDYAFSMAELNIKLKELRNDQRYSSWTNNLRKQQINFIGRYLSEYDIDPNAIIANTVKNKLSPALHV